MYSKIKFLINNQQSWNKNGGIKKYLYLYIYKFKKTNM